MHNMPTSIIFTLNLLVGAGLGAAVGLERQWRQRLAGLRTNALVASGAAAFSALAGLVGNGEDSPTRMAAYVVSGVGFLGAGVIFRDGVNVRGLNTAATIWCSAAVGVLAGAGFVVESAITAMVVLTSNVLLRPIAQRINRVPATATTEVEVSYLVSAKCLDREEPHIRILLLQALSVDLLTLKALRSENVIDKPQVVVTAELIATGRHDKMVERVASRLSMEPSIAAISWEIASPGDLTGVST